MCSLNIKINSTGKYKGMCTKCAKKKDALYYLKRKELPVWYKDGVPQYRVPSVLSCLSDAEKMLIQKVSPFVPLHHIKNGLYGLTGHVCAFEQDIDGFISKLP